MKTKLTDLTLSPVGCYHDMLKYLSEKTGLDMFIKTYINSVNEVLSFNKHTHFVLNGKDLGQLVKQQIKGGEVVLTTVDKSIQIPLNTKFDEIFSVSYRKPKDFNYPIESAGKYVDSLGGGWSSKVDQFKVDDRYFAMMECNCFY